MQNSGPLVWLGFAIIALTAVTIVVPFLLRKADALTAWNILLLGGAMSMGVGSLAVAYGNFHWPELQWFQPTRSDVQKYVIGSIAFYGAMYIAYYYFAWPKRLSTLFLNKWPPMSLPLLLCSLAFFGAVAVGANVAKGVVFFGPLFMNISHKALVFAVVFSFCHWYQHKRQLPMLVLFVGVFVLASLDAMVVFRGRRLLLSVAVAPLICMYWLHWRYLPPKRNLIQLALAAAIAFSVAGFYNAFRHYKVDTGSERTFASTLKAMSTVDLHEAFQSIADNSFLFFGQYCAHYSLLTIQLIDRDQLAVSPFHSLAFMATYPIPRAIYSEKPEPLEVTIVRDVLRLPYQTNWGLGIVATGYHEGGVGVIVLYGILIVVIVRLLDDALVRQPTNPFLLGILSSTAPHFAALIRGGFCVMFVEICEALVFAWALGLVGRFLFGTAQLPEQPASAPRVFPHLDGRAGHVGR